MKTKKVLYTVSNIFSHYIAHTFLPQTFDFHHFITHIYPSHYTPLSPLPYAALHCTSLHFTSLHYTYDLRRTTVELVYLSGRRSHSLLLLHTLKMTFVHRKFRGMLLGNR